MRRLEVERAAVRNARHATALPVLALAIAVGAVSLSAASRSFGWVYFGAAIVPVATLIGLRVSVRIAANAAGFGIGGDGYTLAIVLAVPFGLLWRLDSARIGPATVMALAVLLLGCRSRDRVLIGASLATVVALAPFDLTGPLALDYAWSSPGAARVAALAVIAAALLWFGLSVFVRERRNREAMQARSERRTAMTRLLNVLDEANGAQVASAARAAGLSEVDALAALADMARCGAIDLQPELWLDSWVALTGHGRDHQDAHDGLHPVRNPPE